MNANEVKEMVKNIVTINKKRGMEELNEALIDSVYGWVYLHSDNVMEGLSYEFDEYTDDNVDEVIKMMVNSCNCINGIDGQNPWDSIVEELYHDFGEDKVDEFLDDVDIEWGTYCRVNNINNLRDFQYIVARVCEDEIYEMVQENNIIKGKKFSKDDVMKFLKEAVEEFDEEYDDRKQMWYRKDFKGKYAKCDIAFVAGCDVRMEKIGKIEIDDEDDILIDFVSTDKMENVNVDADVIEMMNKIAA